MTGELRNRALRLLARREHSQVELARKLALHATTTEIEAVLEQLVHEGLLSDARFAEGFVRTRLARFGTRKLAHELRARGVADDVISAVLGGGRQDEAGRAHELWRRKFGLAARTAPEYAKQARFLQNRGFSTDVIRRVLKNESDDE